MGLTQLREAKRKDFVRVEYIENTNTAYIDTNVKGSDNISLQLKYIFKKNSEDTNSGFIFGSRVTNLNQEYGIINSYVSQFRFGDNVSLTDYITNEDILVTLDNTEKHNELKIFDSSNNLLHTLTTTNNSFSNNLNLYIFGINNNGSLIAFSDTTKLYSCKIYDGTTLIRDYIPMYQISTDTYGLWDRVTKEFYTSPNGVEFTGGARVVEDANGKLYYIKNYISFAGSGKSLVSIGLKPNETDYYETKWYFAGSGRSNFMGARTKNNNNDYQCYGYSKAIHIVYDTGALVNYSVTYTNKAYIFKTYFNKKTNQMYGAIYDANKKILAQNKVAKRSGTPTLEFFIGKQNGLNNYYPPVNSRMYYFKYWRNHNLVRDMIPVQSVETGEYGFFDKVNLKIYYSSGSADYTGA